MTRSENYILDFTHIYMNKNIEKESNLLHIDCSDISGSDLYCTKEAEKKIKQRIDEHGIHGIHFTGYEDGVAQLKKLGVL